MHFLGYHPNDLMAAHAPGTHKKQSFGCPKCTLHWNHYCDGCEHFMYVINKYIIYIRYIYIIYNIYNIDNITHTYIKPVLSLYTWIK